MQDTSVVLLWLCEVLLAREKDSKFLGMDFIRNKKLQVQFQKWKNARSLSICNKKRHVEMAHI